MKTEVKKSYSSPRVESTQVELEQGIAAGSASALPGDNGNSVQQEWTNGPDDSRTIDW